MNDDFDIAIDFNRIEAVASLHAAAYELTRWRTPRPPETVEDITARLLFELAAAGQAYFCALARLERHRDLYPTTTEALNHEC